MWIILVLIKMLSSPRTPEPNLLTEIEEDKRNRHEHDSQETQETGSPLIVQRLIHLGRKQGKARTDKIAHEDNARERRSRVRLVAVDDVVEDAQDHDIDAGAEEGGPDDGHDPVDAGVAGPSEPEEADWDEERAEAGHPHARLGHALAAVFGDFSQVVPFLEGVEAEGDDRADGHA